jgi:predicted phage terminase large subunit-like protein
MELLTQPIKFKQLTDSELLYTTKATIRQGGLYNFLYEVLGFKDMNNVHEDLSRFLEGDCLFKLVLTPRYTFKSCICTVGFALWELVKQPNSRILIYSDANIKAEGFLSSLKSHIEGKVENSKFSRYFSWFDEKQKWNQSQIEIRDRTTSFVEPSVDTGGENTSKVGMHYDLIIFDDIVSDKNITTKEQMDKIANCYKKALSLLRPGGKVLMVGTRWHFGDLYGRIIKETEINGVFSIFIVDGEEDKKYGSYCFSNIGTNSLTKRFLDQQKAQQGTYVYSCLYRNNPVDPETATFKHKDFAFYGDIKSEDLYITATCDPAGEGEDFTAITVVGTDCNMDMHILEIVNKHLQLSETINEIIRLHYKYKFKMVGMETNFYRGQCIIELERKIAEARLENEKFQLFGVHEFNATAKRGEGKYNRMLALQPYHERGALKFPGQSVELLDGDFATLAYQMIQFPNSSHDDILDSLAYHLPLIRKGGVVKKNHLPYNSPAYLERKSLEQDLKANSRLPRRLRRRISQELAFS